MTYESVDDLTILPFMSGLLFNEVKQFMHYTAWWTSVGNSSKRVELRKEIFAVISWVWRPLPVTVTNRIITFSVGHPQKPSCTTVTGRWPHQSYISVCQTYPFFVVSWNITPNRTSFFQALEGVHGNDFYFRVFWWLVKHQNFQDSHDSPITDNSSIEADSPEPSFDKPLRIATWTPPIFSRWTSWHLIYINELFRCILPPYRRVWILRVFFSLFLLRQPKTTPKTHEVLKASATWLGRSIFFPTVPIVDNLQVWNVA